MKKALIVGVNEYAPQKPLRGCINDANAMERLLRDPLGYTSIIKLINAEASKSRILGELRKVLEPAPGESEGSRVFFFAGHGGRVLDINDDEGDRIDENLCMPDYQWDADATYILDDELSLALKEAFERAPWMRIYVVFDSCHSGTATRSVSDTLTWTDVEKAANQLGILDPREAGWRLDDPALPILSVARQASDPPDVDVLVRGEPNGNVTIATPPVLGPVNHLLLSGCSAAQTCKDVPLDGDYHGIFSYCLEKTVRANPAITWRELQRATNDLISEGFNQNPQLEGPDAWKDRPVFT
jgi:hypothetical protein